MRARIRWWWYRLTSSNTPTYRVSWLAYTVALREREKEARTG